MYYPVCRGASPWSTNVTGLMLLGGMDDVAYPALCDAIVKGMPPEKLRTVVYPQARHGFDMEGLPERKDHWEGAPAYNAEAAKASWSAVLDFLHQAAAVNRISLQPTGARANDCDLKAY